MARRTSKYISIEAESDDEYESSGISQDLDNLPQASTTARSKSFSEFTREMEDKYGQQESDYGEEELEETAEAPSQTQHLPTPHSPLLLLVRCKIGKEKDICLRIAENASHVDGIFSVLQKDGMKGYLYVESFKKQNVEDVLAGIKFVSRSRLSIVPYREMVEAVSYKKDFVVSEFARVKTGKYKGDAAQVLESYEDTVKVKVIPRINDMKKLFDPEEYREHCVKKDGGYYYNRDFYQNGYLIKMMLKANLGFDVDPTFAELEGLNLKKSFNMNDIVAVQRGELKSLVGRVVNVSGSTATIANENKSYEVNVKDIEKHFSPGDEVSHDGVNGVVLGIDGRQAIVGIRNFSEEVRCPMQELKGPVVEARPVKEAARPLRMRRDPLVNRKVRITEGEHKGLNGVVKDVYRNQCRIQLNSTLEFVLVERNSLSICERVQMHEPHAILYRGISSAEHKASDYTTPSYKTPGYTTPGYKTPGYKTPGYTTPGYKTPGYTTPGYRTPGYPTHGYKTPGSGTSAFKSNYAEEAGTDWLMPKSVYDGTLVNINGDNIVVADFKDGLFLDKEGHKLKKEEVSYVVPQKYDHVVVLDGEHVGKEGALVTISGSEGMMRSRDGISYKVKIVDLSKKSISKY